MTAPDIPEDIRAAAIAVVDRGYDEGLIFAVSQALLSERTRATEAAAKIADSFTCGACGMDGKAAAAIRASIRTEGPKP